MLIRFGAPIFVTSLKPLDTLEIEQLQLGKGTLSFTAKNTGNRHQMVQSIDLKGTDAGGNEVYALTLTDRYLLTGTAKPYATPIAAEQCATISHLRVEVKTDRLSAVQQLDVTHAMCR